jgi:hypothetical protein
VHAPPGSKAIILPKNVQPKTVQPPPPKDAPKVLLKKKDEKN